MSEMFGDAVTRTCASDRDRAIFQLAYGASLLLYKFGDECELWSDETRSRALQTPRGKNRNDLTGSAWSDILCLQLPTGVAL